MPSHLRLLVRCSVLGLLGVKVFDLGDSHFFHIEAISLGSVRPSSVRRLTTRGGTATGAGQRSPQPLNLPTSDDNMTCLALPDGQSDPLSTTANIVFGRFIYAACRFPQSRSPRQVVPDGLVSCGFRRSRPRALDHGVRRLHHRNFWTCLDPQSHSGTLRVGPDSHDRVLRGPHGRFPYVSLRKKNHGTRETSPELKVDS